jgi:hypothetical protein
MSGSPAGPDRPAETPAASLGDVAAEARGADREFTDAAGVTWHVREVVPAPLNAAQRQVLARPDYQRGWLLFESADGDQRRFVPYPRDWSARDDADLASWCAVGVRARHQEAVDTGAKASTRKADRGASWG